MPSNQSPIGALPARFRRERVLIVGCGDVGLRAAHSLRHTRVVALTSSVSRMPELRAAGITPLQGNLDAAAALRRLSGIATRVMHLAPPPSDSEGQWWLDPRTRNLLRALRLRIAPKSFVYVSTSGVYGDCNGDKVTESRPVNPRTPRAQRRVDAERLVRAAGVSTFRATILRAPGIYAHDREGGTPLSRLLRKTPVLKRKDDVFTNHIHADDLARACVSALWRGKAQRIINANDDTELRMGDYFDLAADLYKLPRPPRVPRTSATDELPLGLLSFMSESRRMVNTRLKRELRVRLRYPTVREGLSRGLNKGLTIGMTP